MIDMGPWPEEWSTKTLVIFEVCFKDGRGKMEWPLFGASVDQCKESMANYLIKSGDLGATYQIKHIVEQ